MLTAPPLLTKTTPELRLVLAPPLAAPQGYHVVVQMDALLGNWASENTVSTHFRKECIQATAAGYLYEVSLLHFEQTNGLGLNALSADVAQAKKRLLLEVDATGRLCRVANRAELQDQYAALQPFLLKKYQRSEQVTPGMVHAVGEVLADDAHLVRVLAESYEYRLLFPDLFARTYTAARAPHEPRVVPRLLGALDLPLETVARLLPAPAPGGHALLVEGRPDPARYRAEDARRAVRALTGRYDAAANLRATYLESYELTAPGDVRHAAQLVTAAIPGVFFSKTVATLRAADNYPV